MEEPPLVRISDYGRRSQAVAASVGAGAATRTLARRCRHAGQGLARKSGKQGRELFRREFALRHEDRRTALREKAGVGRLVVVHGVRIWNEHARDAGRRDLRDGAGPGAADHEIRVRIARGHVLDEGHELGLDARAPVMLSERLDVHVSRLMRYARSCANIELSERSGYRFIQHLRT